ncbi:MAG: Ribosomal large subunit pseudouridine synthase D [Syntrophorhabdaceae bacterium PtaU1.Bin034]|nr:MAG: Ribosomal large subunit pseudouridine synthase D [Syntrophorhabdaceae bacterium PtaU1.Bin034]
MDDSFRIIADTDNVRIDVYLSERLSLPRSRVKNLIEGGHVRVQDRIPKPSFKVKRNIEIEGEITSEEPVLLVAEDIPVKILYEDDYLLVIDKPKDMVVHPSLGHRQGTLVNAILNYVRETDRDRNDRPGIVHRLDKGTTGVIIVAKDRKTQETLSSQFHERSVEKVYRAVVEGETKVEEGVVEGEIGRHPRDRKRMAMVAKGGKGGRSSFSRFKVIRRLKGFTYVEVYPKTGRTHQIRVHMSHIGHPVVGDELYGKRARRLTDRPLLHAYRITFDHPEKGDKVFVEAPVPADMQEFVDTHG